MDTVLEKNDNDLIILSSIEKVALKRSAILNIRIIE